MYQREKLFVVGNSYLCGVLEKMKAKLSHALLRQFLVGFKKKKTAGFTLIEVIVAVLIATLVLVALLDLVVDLMNTERKEYGREETQREMQMAMDFMVNELREAAYVYDAKELYDKRGTGDSVPKVMDYLPNFKEAFGDKVEPVLVFWKPEQLPYQQGGTGNIPTSCDSFGSATDSEPKAKWVDCNSLQVRRRAYTLVVYLLKKNDGSDKKWKGKARIIRYQLRKYKGNLGNLEISKGYADPASQNTSPLNWPIDVNDNNKDLRDGTAAIGAGDAAVLVDFVDHPTKERDDKLVIASPIKECEEKKSSTGESLYSIIPPKDNGSSFDNPSFMACVSTNSGNLNKEVVLFVRGNPTGRAGIKVAPLLAIKTTAVARGVVDKQPTN